MGLAMAKTVLVSACFLKVCTEGEQCSVLSLKLR